MTTKFSFKQSFPLLGGALSTLFKNPQIFYPFCILAFVQLFIMEILFFSNRFPLVLFFKPIITRLKGAQYLHYPFNYELINYWFQSAQIFIFLFVSSVVVGKVVLMIFKINSGGALEQKMPKLGLKRYVNLVVAFFAIYLLMYGMTSLYGILIKRAFQIRSTNGVYFLIKQFVLMGAPYFNLLFSIMVTTAMAYVVPVIVLENKNVFIGIARNFKILRMSVVPLFTVIFISSLIYVPVLLVRSNYKWLSSFISPETWQIFVIFGVFVMLFIDAFQYTAITMCYLLAKDE